MNPLEFIKQYPDIFTQMVIIYNLLLSGWSVKMKEGGIIESKNIKTKIKDNYNLKNYKNKVFKYHRDLKNLIDRLN